MRIFLLYLFLQLSNFSLQAQDYNSNQSLIDAIAIFHSLVPNKDPKALIAQFEKLAQNPSPGNAWVPSYYLAIINARLSLKNKELAEAYADKAIAWANASIALNANDENYCALSMAKTAKMAVNPYLRWVAYEKSIKGPLQIAKKTNPNNPRIYILEGSLTLNMPSLFGGGCEKAKPLLIKARDLLNKQVPQKILPTWGQQSLDELRKSCLF